MAMCENDTAVGHRSPAHGVARHAGAVALAVLSAALGLTGLALAARGGGWAELLRGGHADAPVIAVVGGGFGALIVRHRPRNPIGWLILTNAAMQGLYVAANEYALQAVRAGVGWRGGDVAAWLTTPSLIIAAGTLALALLLFPDGRPVSRRWRPLVHVTVADLLVALVLVGTSTRPARGVALLEGNAAPAPLQTSLVNGLSNAARLLFVILAALAIASLFVRYRRSSGAERQQLKWYAYGSAGSLLLLLASRASADSWAGVAAAASPVPLLGATYIAMRRHGLYDIDRIVSRTVTYVGLTAVLIAAYGVAATLLAWSLAFVGGGSTLAVAASAVFAAALFQPARRRLQDISDRAFRRRSHEAVMVMSRYLQSLTDHQPNPGELQAAVAAALQDPKSRVGLWLPEDRRYVDEWGEPFDPVDIGPDRDVGRVERRSEHLGLLTHDRGLATANPQLVATVMRSAAAAMDHARLRAQVGIQVAEIRASRARILAAGDAERRRLERDIHDGAQQRLLAVALTLRRLESRARRAGGASVTAADDRAESLAAAATDVETALSELRRLAHGLAPAELIDQGLAAAVLSLADLAPVPITVDAPDGLRYPQAIETTAYYVVAEALANVAKHAHAQRAVVRIQPTGSVLDIDVSDDGRGGADLAAGSGLIGIRDRVDAAGGTFALDSAVGRGTRIAIVLPVG